MAKPLDARTFMDRLREEVAKDNRRRVDEYDSVRVCAGCGQEIRFSILAEAEHSTLTVSHSNRGGTAMRRYLVSGRWPDGMRASNLQETQQQMSRMLHSIMLELDCLAWGGP
jgi:hypothetical protein